MQAEGKRELPPRSDQSSGSFDCKNCKTNVLKWSGVYDYSRWIQLIAVRDRQASDGKARAGATGQRTVRHRAGR